MGEFKQAFPTVEYDTYIHTGETEIVLTENFLLIKFLRLVLAEMNMYGKSLSQNTVARTSSFSTCSNQRDLPSGKKV